MSTVPAPARHEPTAAGVPHTMTVALPAWTHRLLTPAAAQRFPRVEDRAQVALDLARGNVDAGTGGPFGAALFDLADGRLVAAGVNLVVPARTPIAHAEIVALALAGQAIGTYDVAAVGRYELVASTEPCAMCLGAVPWSGVVSLVCCARDADAREIGFDEGHKPTDWVDDLRRRGVEVTLDVLRPQAREVLQRYATSGAPIYNASGRR